MELDNRYIGAHLCVKISTFAEEIVAKQGMDVYNWNSATEQACCSVFPYRISCNAHSLVIFVWFMKQLYAIEMGLLLFWNLTLFDDWGDLWIYEGYETQKSHDVELAWACVLQ